VNDESMFGEWKREMEEMSGRIKSVRKLLHKELNELNPDRNWDFILSQIGMFSYTGVLHKTPVAHTALSLPSWHPGVMIGRAIQRAFEHASTPCLSSVAMHRPVRLASLIHGMFSNQECV
jgi:hypothetical protein